MSVNFHELFLMMVEKRASHLHIGVGSPIMIRINKVLQPLDKTALAPQDTMEFVESFLNDEQKEIFKREKEISFSHSVAGLSRFRVNVFTQRSTVGIVISSNPPNPPTMEELGLPDQIRNICRNSRQGLVLICGPRGAGKASTLAAMVNFILETRTCQIVTLENPIRYLFKNKKGVIFQREIGTDCKTYERGFETLHHQGADVVVLTDVNTYDMAYQALNLASSGALILCTAMAPSVGVMMEKFVDLFPENLAQQARTLLSVGLEAVICQTLLNRIGGSGLAPAFELLVGIPQVKSLLREGKLVQLVNVMAAGGREYGMQTQEQALRHLVKKTVITPEEAIAKAVRPEEFKKLMALPY